MSVVRVVCARSKLFGKVIQSRLTGKVFPLLVTWSLSARCNVRCKYCYGDYVSHRSELVSTEEALALFEKMADMGMQFLQLSGGEPLMFSGIDQIVDRANERGICLGISTNGSLIPQQNDVVRKIQTVCVSVDGDEAVHDANRGAGTWKMALDGIAAAAAAGVSGGRLRTCYHA